jgi:hypothetical protein
MASDDGNRNNRRGSGSLSGTAVNQVTAPEYQFELKNYCIHGAAYQLVSCHWDANWPRPLNISVAKRPKARR